MLGVGGLWAEGGDKAFEEGALGVGQGLRSSLETKNKTRGQKT